ncbi:MAG TPA: hypothetical protein P5191_10755 [Ruminococcus sp.]|nr:hypothetical protein [Ruminococcus sp.]
MGIIVLILLLTELGMIAFGTLFLISMIVFAIDHFYHRGKEDEIRNYYPELPPSKCSSLGRASLALAMIFAGAFLLCLWIHGTETRFFILPFGYKG